MSSPGPGFPAAGCVRVPEQSGSATLLEKGKLPLTKPTDPGPQSLEDPTERRRRFLINLFYFGLCAGLAVLVLAGVVRWLMPFVLAFATAALLQRPIRWLVKKTGVNRQYFSVALMILMILLLAGGIALLCWRLAITVTNFISNEQNMQAVQDWIGGVTQTVRDLLDRLARRLSPEALETVNTAIDSLSGKLMEALSGLFAGAATWLMRFATQSLPSLALSFFIWVLASILLSIHYQGVRNFLVRQIPGRFMDLLRDAKVLCGETACKLVKAYGLLMLLTFAELSVGLLMLRVPYAILVAALIAVVDILPVLGTGTVVIPWAVVCLLTGNTRMFIGLLILYAVIAVVRNILEPRMVSRQIGLHPLATLLFMYLGLKTVGILGMLLFPALAMVLQQLHDAGKLELWK